MDNFLDNGAVLPHGLLGHSSGVSMAGFNKTYKNTALRMGIVIKSYPTDDDANLTKLTTEYDVLVFEQNEDKGSSIMTYKNCLSAEGLGSIADFFEKTLRVRSGGNLDGELLDTKDQDGAVVLIHCLDGVSEKAIIMGAITHPDRKSTITDDEPHLEGEFNGVNIKVDADGSTTLTFRGATDSQGEPLDDSQGDTTVKIEADGSFQVDHDSVTFRMDRDGDASLTAKKDINLTAEGNINVVAQGDVNVTCTNVKVDASGQADITVGGDTNLSVGGNCAAKVDGSCKVESSGKTSVKASTIELNGSSGSVLTTATDPVVDTIFGIPTMGVPTVKSG